MDPQPQIWIGWASVDMTPERPVLLAGQFHARISEGVMDPVTATALALSCGESGLENAVVMVSCDLVAVSDGLLEAVRAILLRELPQLDPRCVVLNATHTHTGPELRMQADSREAGGGIPPDDLGVELAVLYPAECFPIAARRIAQAVMAAWRARKPGALGFGLGHAVVGRNRRSAYFSGESRMYGKTNAAGFSHIEGWEDHAVNYLAAWDAEGKLSGLVVNVPCPSQVSEHEFLVSADYWHDTRQELRRRLGADLFVLAQCSAAGDQSPHVQIGAAAEERMDRLVGRTERQGIALRIADAITGDLPHLARERRAALRFAHRVGELDLPRRELSAEDIDEALVEAEKLRVRYEMLRHELEEHPEKRSQPRWYVPITEAYRQMRWYQGVRERRELQHIKETLHVETHLVRLGDIAFATNPFELYLDFGARIKARSPALQTFIVQLAGSGGYLPSARAVAGRGYGAVAASAPVGPEGGQQLVEWSVAGINELWA